MARSQIRRVTEDVYSLEMELQIYGHLLKMSLYNMTN